MKPFHVMANLICVSMALSCREPAVGAQPKVESATLKNGVRVGYLYEPESKHLSIFSFLPMGLASDEADRCGWSHLLEHLVIRTTDPASLQEANAETVVDHMRLDFYGTVGNWREGLSRHARWLGGMPFTKQTLKAEKVNANSEGDIVAPKLFTHKFAFSAWSQICRHGRAHAGVKADVNAATLKDIQQYRDQHLFIPQRTFVCAIGGVDPKEFLAAVEESIGKLTSDAKPLAAVSPRPGDRDATWDLDARHIMLVWPIAAPANVEDHGPLMLAAPLVMALAAQDANLSKLAGPVLAGADLASPEGWHFYVSAALRPGASVAEVRRILAGHVEHLKQVKDDELPVADVGRMLAGQLRPQNPESLKAQMPPGLPAGMAEAQVGLMWGTQEFRYGSQRELLAKKLEQTSAAQVRRVADKWLGAKQCSVLIVHPPTKSQEAP